MKKILLILLLILTPVLTKSQDTTKVLFIGNSFTFFNEMQNMVILMAREAEMEIGGALYLPGGYDFLTNGVNDPQLFNSFRADKWDVVFLQDNQGRLVLDSNDFNPGYEQAVISIIDSVKTNSPCANIIWFAGWGFKGGMPQNFPGDNSIRMIGRILHNSKVLNEQMKVIVAPIGEAWIRCLEEKPEIELWSNDDAHPAPYGSFLAACVYFESAFKMNPKALEFNSGLDPNITGYLKKIAHESVMKPENFEDYKLKDFTPEVAIQGNTMIAQDGYEFYQWYKDFQPIDGETGISLNPSAAGYYTVMAEDAEGCEHQSIAYSYPFLAGIDEKDNDIAGMGVYPNPADEKINIDLGSFNGQVDRICIIDYCGRIVLDVKEDLASSVRTLDISNLTEGVYFVRISGAKSVKNEKIIVY